MNIKDLDPDTLLRVDSIIAPNGPLPISKSTFWNYVRRGILPPGRKLSERVTCWRAGDIQKLIAAGNSALETSGSRLTGGAE